MSLGVGLESLKTGTILSLLSWLPACGLRCEPSALNFQLQPPCLLFSVSTILEPNPLEMAIQNKLILLKVALVVVLN